jgi:hypothetical protein
LSEPVFEAETSVLDDENPVPKLSKLTPEKPRPGRRFPFPSKGDLCGIEIKKIDIGDRDTP